MLLFILLGDTYPQKQTVKQSVASSNTEKYIPLNNCSGPGPFFGRRKTPDAAAGHDTLVLRTKTLLASMAHESTDRTSRRAEVPPPEESTKGGGRRRRPPPFVERREAPPPLVEESQPSGLSGPHAHAPCRLKVSLSLKLRCLAPQLPPAFFSGPKIGQGRKLVKKVKIWKVLRMGLPIVENLSGLQESIFSLSRRPQLHFGQKSKN